MGLYAIDCSSCKKPFLWFSGNHLDQRCKDCRDRATVIDALKVMTKAIETMSDETLLKLIESSGVTEDEAKQYARLEKLITGD